MTPKPHRPLLTHGYDIAFKLANTNRSMPNMRKRLAARIYSRHNTIVAHG